MLAAVKIKEEPLDEIEDSQEIFNQKEALLNQQTNDESSLASSNFHIVEEQDTIITVSAAEMRSEDEKRFIDALNSADPTKFKGICSKCLKPFSNRSQFLKHTRRNHCVTKQWCPVCPVTFIDASSMLNHLKLHQENYFFCSHHCGANYATLPLCEEHELKEHKIQATPKVRFKHFCSFCRVGFKTELQLHVHWLQQSLGCGKLMQEVVLHSANLTTKYNDSDAKKTKDLLLDKQLQSPTTNSVSTIPITKLRLKYDTASTNKRQNTDNTEDTCKRLRVQENLKTETDYFNYETDIQIKEEPADDYEGTITSSLIPEVIIKTEEEDTVAEKPQAMNQKPVMKNLIINNNMIGPESSGKFIPLEQLVSPENIKTESGTETTSFSINTLVNSNATNINNNAVGLKPQNLPVLKIVNTNGTNMIFNNNPNSLVKRIEGSLRLIKIAPGVASAGQNINCANLNFLNTENFSNAKLKPIKLASGQNLNNVDIKPLPKSGLQILKLLPNTQILSMKPSTNNNNSLLAKNSSLVLKLKNSQSSPTQTANQTPTSTLSRFGTATSPTPACSSSTSPAKKTNTVSIKLNCLEKNTTIDAEDFKKLQAEALIKAEEHRKNFYVPKTRLMIIENIPEKKQLIDDMKQQIAKVNNKTTEQIQSNAGANFVLNSKSCFEPPWLYLPILTTIDVKLVQARYENPNYNYKWICPYCMKEYEIKTALKMHLIKAHNLNNRDMEKINVQAKPYRIEAPDESADEILEVKEEPIEQDNDSQSQATSEAESFTVTDKIITPVNQMPKGFTNMRPQRQRHVCDKCGRTCSSKTMLNDHILAKCSREPQYSCHQCPKKFYSHGTLQCHMTIHTGELPHKCNYCDKCFRTRGQVKVHHRTHTGERPFFCQVCSQRFTHRETLIAHLSRHIGMKRYKCYGCDKHFSCISALKTHREIRADTCGKVKFNPRAIGPRVRVIRGNVIFEPQPEINPYLKSEDPKCVLSELQNQSSSTPTKNQSEDSKSVIFEIKKTA